MTPYGIENRLKLRNPINFVNIQKHQYKEGHMGRNFNMLKFCKKGNVKRQFIDQNLKEISTNLELFTWENLDLTDQLKENFS